MGAAKPTPANTPVRAGSAIETTMPTTSPCSSTSGPPKLPGLTDESNWMRPETLPSRVSAVRFRPETTPAETLKSRPSGLPIATTSVPTTGSPPRFAGTTTCGSLAGESVAVSCLGLAELIEAAAVVPSAKVTVMLLAPAMT